MLAYRSAVLAVCCLFATTATQLGRADEKEDLTKKDMAALQGTWILESGERNGGDGFPDAFKKEFKFTFDGNKLNIGLPGSELKSTYTIDPTKKPKQLDITTENKIVSPAIYSIEKDTLKVVMDSKDKTRAEKFTTEKGGSHMYFTFKRKK